MKVLIITGSKGAGKSSFINRIFMETNEPLNGIRSVRNFENEVQNGFDLVFIKYNKEIKTTELLRYKSDQVYINKNFSQAAIYLDEFSSQENKLVFVDEIGRFEKDDKSYQASIIRLLNSKNIAIISLKKEDLDFNKSLIEKAQDDKDIIFIDFDQATSKEKLEIITQIKTNYTNKPLKNELCVFVDDSISEKTTASANHLLEKAEVYKIDNIFSLNLSKASRLREKKGLSFYFSKDIQRLKKAADLGFIATDKIENIK